MQPKKEVWITCSHHVPAGLARKGPQRITSLNVRLDPKQTDLSPTDLMDSALLRSEMERAFQ
jgi:hypothetical protein